MMCQDEKQHKIYADSSTFSGVLTLYYLNKRQKKRTTYGFTEILKIKEILLLWTQKHHTIQVSNTSTEMLFLNSI